MSPTGALELILWKLDRNEMVGDECVPARIDRRDAVVVKALEVLTLRRQQAEKDSHR